jgi:hypothetical protein
MSKLDAPAKRIPTGILVSASSAVSKPERPRLKRKVEPLPRARQDPWLWIVTGGSTAWALLILAFGLSIESQRRPKPCNPPAESQAMAMIASKPVATVNRVEAIATPTAKFIVEAPKLVRAKPLLDDTGPAIPDNPGMVEALRPQEAQPQEQTIAQVQAPPERKDIDLSPFANCKQIGTNILFMRDPPEAFKRAKAEKKLVFMVHLSGNLEDSGFT